MKILCQKMRQRLTDKDNICLWPLHAHALMSIHYRTHARTTIAVKLRQHSGIHVKVSTLVSFDPFICLMRNPLLLPPPRVFPSLPITGKLQPLVTHFIFLGHFNKILGYWWEDIGVKTANHSGCIVWLDMGCQLKSEMGMPREAMNSDTSVCTHHDKQCVSF